MSLGLALVKRAWHNARRREASRGDMDQAIKVAATPARLSLGEKLLVAIAAYFLALKLIYAFGAAPIADEAYYWLWGRPLSIGYFDHPPLLGWLNGLVYSVLGRSLFALRLPSLLALAAALFIFYDVARRIGGDKWRLVFLKSTVIYLASPLFGWFGSVVFVDYLLVALLMASGWLFFRYFAEVEAEGQGRVRELLLAALLLGLAGLTKYNAGYLGLAVVATVLTRPKLRPLLLDWPIYAAGALTLATLTPLAIWSIEQSFASFQFHAAGRFDAVFDGMHIDRMKAFALDTMSLLGPFMVPALISFFLRRQRGGYERVGKTFAIWTFWLSTATFLYISNYAWVMWWWNSAAFVLALPFLGRYIDPVMLALHSVWGAVVSTALVVRFAIVPVTRVLGQQPFMETESAYGWDHITEEVRRIQADTGAAFVATNRYQSASQLAFALDDPLVLEISPRRTAFDEWMDEAAHLGQSGIVLVDGRDDIESWKRAFDNVELVTTLEIERFGYPIATYEVFLGEGFVPLAAAGEAP